MESLISLEQLQDLAVSRPAPPYFLLIAGLLITLACVVPLMIVSRQRVKYWASHSSSNALPAGGRLQVILPFSGTAGGICIFLASGFEILGLPVLPSLIVSLVLTITLSILAWMLLGRLLSRQALRFYMDQSSDFPPVGNPQ